MSKSKCNNCFLSDCVLSFWKVTSPHPSRCLCDGNHGNEHCSCNCNPLESDNTHDTAFFT